jgi:hypothetical protein
MLLNHEFIDDFFSSMNMAKVEFLVLRNYEKLPYEIGNDIDILVRKQDLTKCDLIIKNCLRLQGLGGPLISRRYGIVTYYVNDGVGYYPIDIMYELCKQWVSYVFFDDLIKKKIRNKNFWVPNYSHQFFITMSKEVLTYGRVRYKYFEEISLRLNEVDFNLIRGLMERNFNFSDVEKILEGIEQKNIDLFFEKVSLRRNISLFFDVAFFKWLWFRFMVLIKG